MTPTNSSSAEVIVLPDTSWDEKKEDAKNLSPFFPSYSGEFTVTNRDCRISYNPVRAIYTGRFHSIPKNKNVGVVSLKSSLEVPNLWQKPPRWELEPPPILLPYRRGISVDSVVDPIKLRSLSSTLSRIKVSEHFEQQKEFPVKPYYPDQENLPPIIPPRLQVKASFYTLRFCSTYEDNIDTTDGCESGPSDGVRGLEKVFF